MSDPDQSQPSFFSFPFPTTQDGNDFDLSTNIHVGQEEFMIHPIQRPRNSEDGPSDPQQNPLTFQKLPLPNHPLNFIPNPPSNPPQSKRSALLFKTRLCTKFKLRSCPYGSNCNFAHGRLELRPPHPNWQELVSDEGLAGNCSDQRKVHKQRVCRKFYNGEECPYGDACSFLHKKPMEAFRESSAISVETLPIRKPAAGVDVNGSYSLRGNKNATCGGDCKESMTSRRPALWKTNVCQKQETTGHCPFGERCNFARGYEELKKFGGHVDSGSLNIGVAPARPLLNLPDVDGSPSQGAPQPQTQQLKSLLKWKMPRKISGIYEDWID